MELSRRKVPLYGQAKVFALLEVLDSMQEDAEVYIVLEGSTLVHVTPARNDVMLYFLVPGHNLAEVVSVQAYLCSETTPLTWVGGATLEYVQDDAQDLAEHLVMHGHHLSATDHKELSSLFNLGQQSSRCAADRRVTLAMANLDIPQNWNVLGSHSREGRHHKESPLHLAVRWGLCRLTELLLCQPGGLLAINLPNEDGVTPLQLAQSSGNRELMDLLTRPPNPLATPPAGLSQVWADRSRLLRFCHDTGNLTLTVRQNLRWSSEESRHADILLLRDRLRNEGFLREIKSFRRERVETLGGKEELADEPAENGLYAHMGGDNSPAVENDYEEPLMFCMNQEEQEDDSSESEKSQSIGQGQSSSPTLAAAARLSAMIHGKDRVYANAMLVDQVDDVDIKYRLPGDETTHVDTPSWDSHSMPSNSVNSPKTRRLFSSQHAEQATSGHCSENKRAQSPLVSPRSSPSPFISSPSFPSSPLASAFRLFEGGQRRQPGLPVSPALVRRGCSLPATTQILSPSLECDSGEEDVLGLTYPCSTFKQQSSLRSSSGEERDSFEATLEINRTLSDSTDKSSKNQEEAEVRLRSYSYSSPKAKPSRPLLNREATITDLAEGGAFSNGGRSLLQALSLSKSLSRLHQVKQSAFGPSDSSREKRILGFRKRAQSAEEERSASPQHLTLSEFLKEIEDEEWDKYIIPSKVESEKYKVSRTFSFLKNRMSSTRNKAKVKGKDVKEAKEKTGATNTHQFIPSSPSGPALCVACEKSVSGKELLQCSNCFLTIHKNCRELAAACGKKLQEKSTLLLKSKIQSLPQSSQKESSPVSPVPSSTSLPAIIRERKDSAALSKSLSVSVENRRLSDAGLDAESGINLSSNGSVSDEGTPVTVTPPSLEPQITASTDTVETQVQNDLSSDLIGLEAESWSLAVCPDFCGQNDRRTVKRQDVIYELMQTELHHNQTLTVMSEVFRRGMLEEVQLDAEIVSRIFPSLDPLVLFHQSFLGALQERRQASVQPEDQRNYLIHQVGDILLQQFSDENAEKMKQLYADFCSHHIEALNLYKEQKQQNKKLQNFVKSNNSLVRRRGVPEFILLVTQRITKYPVLLERIIRYTPEGSQEHADLSSALAQIRDIITAVDLAVSKYEKSQELQEVLTRLENKSFAKLKNGKVVRKQDLQRERRELQHKGLVYWKTATGRLKDTLALLLTDVLVFLQEKDQRFMFAAVDQKPPVIPLQKLIVREVANEERGMFLISASSVGPEMYEIHTASKEERNSWMRHIRQAVESCPEEEEEEEQTAETEEAKRAAEVRVQKIAKFQETLLSQDQRICNSLEEKLQLYAELTDLTLRSPEAVQHRHLLVQPESDGDAPRQARSLLTAALREAENLIQLIQTRDGVSQQILPLSVQGPGSSNYNSHGSSVPESPSEQDYLSTLSVSSTSLASEGDLTGLDGVMWSSGAELRRGDAKDTLHKVVESVQSLTQLLYSLQAAVTLQDSCTEVHKLLLQEAEKPQVRSAISLQSSQEQERQRNLDRRKEDVEKKSMERKEMDEVQKLHMKLKQEQQRWDKECVAREKHQLEQESGLEEREQCCLLEAERLRCEREELEAQLQEYQQNLERLKEGQRSVEREKEKIEAQQRLLQSWKHTRQSSLPVTIPLDGYQALSSSSNHSRSGSLDGNLSVYENEAAFIASLKKNHMRPMTHNNLSQPGCPRRNHQAHVPPAYSANVALSASLYNSLNTLLSQGKQPTDPPSFYSHSHSPFKPHEPEQTLDFSPQPDRRTTGSWRPPITDEELYCDDYSSPSLTPLLPPQSYLSLDGQSGDEGGEENIVYL
ncbi:rho guanine nucleotide exchange factor 28-like isoform X2 [Synchiropus splendidus]|uniref:rho guanine nucleotide exchange factor 28-like isoform X2 n=1 Tax=Synchiropus splendidus TaxID=270530 RepID=UPI00237E3077|nr:rho guanine nucleotide exchange factor 28-like isoform X2 [Synchiropus splendidus]